MPAENSGVCLIVISKSEFQASANHVVVVVSSLLHGASSFQLLQPLTHSPCRAWLLSIVAGAGSAEARRQPALDVDDDAREPSRHGVGEGEDHPGRHRGQA